MRYTPEVRLEVIDRLTTRLQRYVMNNTPNKRIINEVAHRISLLTTHADQTLTEFEHFILQGEFIDSLRCTFPTYLLTPDPIQGQKEQEDAEDQLTHVGG